MLINITKADLVGIARTETKIIEKEWGREHVLPCEGHTTKMMEVKPGFRCSLHFHRVKNEAFILIQGHLYVEFYEQDSTKHEYLLTEPLSTLILPAGTPHTFSVPNNQDHATIFIESSTVDDPDDSYRLTKSGMYA